jgi:hypothetical protein
MAAAGVAVIVGMRNLPVGRSFDALRLAAIVPSAAAAYIVAAKLLRVKMLSMLRGGKRQNQ